MTALRPARNSRGIPAGAPVPTPGGLAGWRGPSRNGITARHADFIAFLDADDFYLPGRFTVVRQVFAERPDCDGVYEAVGMHFEDEEGKTRWLESDMAGIRMTTMEPGIPPGELYAVLTRGGRGHIHLNGLVIRREVLGRSGVFNESIPNTRGEDDFILRLSAVGQLCPAAENRRPAAVHAQTASRAARSAEHPTRPMRRALHATPGCVNTARPSNATWHSGGCCAST